MCTVFDRFHEAHLTTQLEAYHFMTDTIHNVHYQKPPAKIGFPHGGRFVANLNYIYSGKCLRHVK